MPIRLDERTGLGIVRAKKQKVICMPLGENDQVGLREPPDQSRCRAGSFPRTVRTTDFIQSVHFFPSFPLLQ
jgi:hypothetical protein